MKFSILHAVNGSLSLISTRDKIILLLVVFSQTFLALFDLAGIALIGFVVALGASSVSKNTPTLLSRVLDTFGLENVQLSELLLWLSISAGVLLVSKSVISFLIIKRTYRFLALRQALISSNIVRDLLDRPVLFIQKWTTQDITVALTTGANAATLGVIGSATLMASEIPVLLILGIGLSFVDPFVTIFTIAFFGLIGIFIHRVLARRGKKLGSSLSSVEIESLEAIQESVVSFKEISVFGRQKFYVEKVKKLRLRSSELQGTLAVMNQATKYIYEIMLIVGGGLLLIIQLMTHDVATAVTIISVFLAAASRLMPSLLRMQNAAIAITYSSGVAEPTIQLAQELLQSNTQTHRKQLERALFDQDSVQSKKSEKKLNFVEVSNVSFRYPGAEQQAVRNFSLSLREGQSVALVGPTGAGKSTIADIVLGLIEPDSGSISISGNSPRENIILNPGQIAYVPQATSIVRGNIRDNVALGVPARDVDDSRIWEALTRAQLSNFLSVNREGLETLVGERGIQLSGGQRQRLGLARALYTRPELLVLDEATSALDAETEAAITEALSSLEGQVTTITIAHRIATIRNCDVIIYLENGAEVARGNFEELKKISPSFYNQAQLSGL